MQRSRSLSLLLALFFLDDEVRFRPHSHTLTLLPLSLPLTEGLSSSEARTTTIYSNDSFVPFANKIRQICLK